jgi:hypothetical protein
MVPHTPKSTTMLYFPSIFSYPPFDSPFSILSLKPATQRSAGSLKNFSDMKYILTLFIAQILCTSRSYASLEIVVVDSSMSCHGGTITIQCFFDDPSASLSWFLADVNENVMGSGSCTLENAPVFHNIAIDDVDSGMVYFLDMFLTAGDETIELYEGFVVPTNSPGVQLVEANLSVGDVSFAFDVSLGESQVGLFVFTILSETLDVVYIDEGTLLPWDNLEYVIPLLPAGNYILELSINNGCDEVLYSYACTVHESVSVAEQKSLPHHASGDVFDSIGKYIGSKSALPHALPCDVYFYPHGEYVKKIVFVRE